MTCRMLPATSKDCYLSGMAALNLPSDKGTGDWHKIETFFRPHQTRSRSFLVGEGCEVDTRPYLADIGVFECSAILDKLRIPYPNGEMYAANHARAIVDLVLAAVLSGGAPDFVTLDDWMPRDEDKQEVYEMIEIAINKLDQIQKNKVIRWKEKNSV